MTLRWNIYRMKMTSLQEIVFLLVVFRTRIKCEMVYVEGYFGFNDLVKNYHCLSCTHHRSVMWVRCIWLSCHCKHNRLMMTKETVEKDVLISVYLSLQFCSAWPQSSWIVVLLIPSGLSSFVFDTSTILLDVQFWKRRDFLISEKKAKKLIHEIKVLLAAVEGLSC